MVRHQEPLRKCSQTGAGGPSCFLGCRPPPACAPPIPVVSSCVRSARPAAPGTEGVTACAQGKAHTPPLPFSVCAHLAGPHEPSLACFNGRPDSCCYQTLAHLPPVARKEGPCLVLHYYSSGALCSARHAAGCLPYLLNDEDLPKDEPFTFPTLSFSRAGRLTWERNNETCSH